MVWFNMLSIVLQVFNIVFIIQLFRLIKGNTYQTVSLSCGSFKIRKRNFDVQNVTNIVSLHYFNGGQIPAEIRKEILQKLTPKVEELIIAKKEKSTHTQRKRKRRKPSSTTQIKKEKSTTEKQTPLTSIANHHN